MNSSGPIEQEDKQLYERMFLPAENFADPGPTATKLLSEWSGIPPADQRRRILELRDKAYKIFPYPCVGGLRFLEFPLSKLEYYPQVLSLLKSDPDSRFLDIGCCFGSDIRQLRLDGVPASQVYGAELRKEYIDLGYEFFNDEDKLGVNFTIGDVLDEETVPFKKLHHTVDVLHMASFLHLWELEPQTKVLEQVFKLMKPKVGVIMLGRQVGNDVPGGRQDRPPGKQNYRHNPESMQKMWDEMGRRTGTEWKVDAVLKNATTMAKELDMDGDVKDRRIIWFTARRTK